jgi:hypothetical protein
MRSHIHIYIRIQDASRLPPYNPSGQNSGGPAQAPKVDNGQEAASDQINHGQTPESTPVVPMPESVAPEGVTVPPGYERPPERREEPSAGGPGPNMGSLGPNGGMALPTPDFVMENPKYAGVSAGPEAHALVSVCVCGYIYICMLISAP